MRILIQRVNKASVTVDNEVIGKINKGYLVLLGIGNEDTTENVDYLVKKLFNLRIFEDENNKMNLSITDVKGELLIVSQFTLYADTTSGNRPSFKNAAKSEKAEELYNYFINECKKNNNCKVEKGCFGAYMKVELLNDGPVTILLENN